MQTEGTEPAFCSLEVPRGIPSPLRRIQASRLYRPALNRSFLGPGLWSRTRGMLTLQLWFKSCEWCAVQLQTSAWILNAPRHTHPRTPTQAEMCKCPRFPHLLLH